MFDCKDAYFLCKETSNCLLIKENCLKTLRRLVSRLLYLNLTSPDISYASQHLSQFLSAPKYTIDLRLFYFAQNPLALTGYNDADWESCSFSSKSLIGYCIFISDALISCNVYNY
ncbi:LOW QUALITY PROTEIN: hypothetical protein V2J09_016994 [Rumex salicifolius]